MHFPTYRVVWNKERPNPIPRGWSRRAQVKMEEVDWRPWSPDPPEPHARGNAEWRKNRVTLEQLQKNPPPVETEYKVVDLKWMAHGGYVIMECSCGRRSRKALSMWRAGATVPKRCMECEYKRRRANGRA